MVGGAGVPRLTRSLSITPDHVGGLAAGLCGLHCAVMPMIPVLAGLSLASEWMETGCLLLSLGVGVAALSRGWRRHRNFRPLVLWLVGSLIALLAHVSEAVATDVLRHGWLLFGVGLQVFSHWSNHRYSCATSC